MVQAAAQGPAAATAANMLSPQQLQALMQQQQAMDAGGGGESKVVAARQKGEALSLAGASEESIKKKIEEVAMGILGLDDGDDLEGDMPFMNAGLTSASSVLFRDELASEMPGVNLPFTLVFDYPSVNAVTDLIMEKVGGS
eukprot:gnl/TRDRNA2_/TRDRNA2_43703_c0_seq1.p1 gnl/TRDRNA2_/TRDRNA2_43703_c0~~gnl/TRDRNA2_/TRDRNA2_43703_c0_seq1.p1  ORF type:complete len:156 (+),score=47.50 gnl/TRDRNA2_/TRDRNA2_43703_c0_seq1:46-468(+)